MAQVAKMARSGEVIKSFCKNCGGEITKKPPHKTMVVPWKGRARMEYTCKPKELPGNEKQ